MPALSSLRLCSVRTLAAALALAVSVCAQQPPAVPPAEPPVPQDSTWCDVLVVDAETGAPLPGIEVLWQDDQLGQWPLPSIDGPLHQPTDARFVPFQRRATSDAAGRLRVHFGSQALLHVGTGSFRGSLFVGGRGDGRSAPVEPQRLVLEPFEPWPVRVLDAADRPIARASVLLALADATDADTSGLAANATGPDGTAELAIPKALFAAGERAPRVRAVASLASREGSPLVVVATALPKPLVLRAPPVGTVRAILTIAGARCTESGFVDVMPRSDAGRQQTTSAPLGADGSVEVHGVPLDVELLVRCRLDNLQVERVVEGPVRAEQTVDVTIDLAAAPCTLTGRLLGPDGTPLGAGHVQATAMASGAAWNLSLPVDGDGRFRWRLCEGEIAPGKVDALSLSRPQRSGANWTFTRQQVELSASGIDLGDLSMRAPPVLLRARVSVDGVPAIPPTGIVVEVQQAADGSGGWQPARGFLFEPRWGGFLLWGDALPRRHRLRFADPSFVATAPVEFDVGANGVDLHLERACTLAAEALLPDGLAAADVRFELVPARGSAPRGAADGPVAWLAETEAKGDLAVARWQSLPRGLYTLHVAPQAWRTPALTVHDVEVPLPEGGDSRLTDIDLRPRVRMLKVRVTRPQGREAPGETAAVFVEPDEAQAEWYGVAVQHGLARVPVPLRPVDLLVAAPDLQPNRLRDVRGDVQTELRAWPMLRVDFDESVPLPPEFELSVHVDAGAVETMVAGQARIAGGWVSRYRLLQPMPVRYDSVGKGLIVAPAAVERQLIAWLRAPWGARPLLRLEPDKAPAGAGRVRVRIDADELARAVAGLRAEAPATHR